MRFSLKKKRKVFFFFVSSFELASNLIIDTIIIFRSFDHRIGIKKVDFIRN